MPHRRSRGGSQLLGKVVVADPLTDCLDANGTYICTAYNPRCYIIQKVTPSFGNASLNPNADEFESKQPELGVDVPPGWDPPDAEIPNLEGYVYMNGDIGKLPAGAVYPATPDSLATAASTSSDYSTLNGVVDSLETYAPPSTPPGGSPTDPSPGPDSGIPLDQLKQMLASQLEYYFSRENLANDAYLLSQMDNDQYVPIWTVANFNQVKKLTKDIKLITEVLRESPNVQVDEEGQKVRPNHKRCIVILREIPDNTPLEEVKALFSGEGCPRLISCEFAHNNSWYVTFESDEDAQRAYRFLREEVREFQGKPIMARIKAKPMNRLPLPAVPTMGAAAAMKNGYRTPPTAMYDPNAAYQNQQRFVYTNGSSIPPSVNYGNQVHVYTFQQPPFYPPSMLQPWSTASPACQYFDIGSVFSVNGLAPQGSFTKPQGGRYMPRNNRSKRNQLGGDRVSDVGMARQSGNPHAYHYPGGAGPSSLGKSPSNLLGAKIHHQQLQQQQVQVPSGGEGSHHNHSKSHHQVSSVLQDGGEATGSQGPMNPGGAPPLRPDPEDISYGRQSREAAKEPMPPRHRRKRKEDEIVSSGRTTSTNMGGPGVKPSTSGGSPQPVNRDVVGGGGGLSLRGAQFDLEATAFPPLPGLDGGGGGSSAKMNPPAEPAQAETSGSHWENRLSDVVKGTAKPKSASLSSKEKESSSGGSGGAGVNNSPRPLSPASPSPKLCPPPPETKPPPPLQQQTSQAPAPVPAQPPAVPLPETKEVGTGSEVMPACSGPLTPPASPDKTVPVAKCMADKSTKTDDTLLNVTEAGSNCILGPKTCEPISSSNASSSTTGGCGGGAGKPQTSMASIPPPKAAPTTTNAATMTSAVVVTDVTTRVAVATTNSTGTAPTTTPAAASTDLTSTLDVGGPARLSYAQVAQHHKEKVEQMLLEKQSSEQQEAKDKERRKDLNPQRGVQQHGESRDAPQREFREGSGRFVGRGGPRPTYDRSDRGGVRRRDGPDRVPRYREFLRPRSPK